MCFMHSETSVHGCDASTPQPPARFAAHTSYHLTRHDVHTMCGHDLPVQGQKCRAAQASRLQVPRKARRLLKEATGTRTAVTLVQGGTALRGQATPRILRCNSLYSCHARGLRLSSCPKLPSVVVLLSAGLAAVTLVQNGTALYRHGHMATRS